MPHHRARFSARGREAVVRRVVDDGETFAQAAASANVSTSTVWTWVDRGRVALTGDALERARQEVRQDCSFPKKQESPPALLVRPERACGARRPRRPVVAQCGSTDASFVQSSDA